MSIIPLSFSRLSVRAAAGFAMGRAADSSTVLGEFGTNGATIPSRATSAPVHRPMDLPSPRPRPPATPLPPHSSGVKTLLLLRGRWDGREMVPSSSSSPSFHAGNLIKSSSLLHHCRRRRRLTQRPKPDCTLLAASPASLSLSLSPWVPASLPKAVYLFSPQFSLCSFPFLTDRQCVIV